jgi:hypothetical protein
MMKTWLITLPLLCAAGVAMAQGAEKEGAADQPAAVAAPAERAAAQAAPTVAPVEPAAAPAQAEATPEAKAPVKTTAKATAPAKPKPKPRHRMGKRAAKPLPTGDVRYCLDRKSDAEIIRCSETRRKK